MNPRADTLKIFRAGISAARADRAVARALKLDGRTLRAGNAKYDLRRCRRILVVGAGKAAAGMARGVEMVLGPKIAGGLIVVKSGHALSLRRIDTVEAGHPFPDGKGRRGAAGILRLARSAGEDDLLICLFSGGASALLPSPPPGISLADLRRLSRLLLNCGAAIREINIVRKHVSLLQGGRLARVAFPATVLTLLISDVVGDDPASIASGPTAPDPSTFSDARSILKRYGLDRMVPRSVREYLERGIRNAEAETPTAGDPVFLKVRNLIVADNRLALAAAARKAGDLGYHPFILSAVIEGDTREAARFHAAVAREIIGSDRPVRRPACLLSGGETTVEVKGRGRGGRNQEFVLTAGSELRGDPAAVVFSAGTDGSDGPTEAAGAVMDAGLWERARIRGLIPEKYLADNDSYHFFRALGGLVLTGPTGTNVMDLRIILIR